MNLKKIFFSSEIQHLVSFLAYSPHWKLIIEKRKKFPCNRELLVHRLLEQNCIHFDEKVQENIRLLSLPNTFTITTGHQLCFGTGPLYVIYKTLSIIELCKKLNQKYTEYYFVPVFWLASEDHDFLEVNHFYRDYQTRIEYLGKFEGAVGRHNIHKEYIRCSSWVVEPYLHQRNWKDAFQELLSSIFAEEGLIFIDGDDKNFKSSFSSFFLKEILERPTQKNVTDTNAELKKLNIKVQWNVSEINLFYLTDNQRDKIHYKDNEYFIGNKKVTLDWLLNEVEQYPERISPSAGFRPLYQEFLLPNLAYVGGWGEIHYWLQLKSNFEEFQVFYPLLIPRFSYTYIPVQVQQKLLAWGHVPSFLLKPLKTIQRTIAQKYYDFEDFKKHFFSIYQNISDLQNHVKDVSESLVYSLETQKFYWSKIYHQLENKLIKIIQNQNPREFFEIYRLKDQIQPEGFIQERTLNISAFVAERDELDSFFNHIKTDLGLWVENYV